MRAIVFHNYGQNDVLEIADIPEPKIGPDSILISVRCAGVNPVDWKSVRGYLDGGFPSFFPIVPGWDVAGVVEAIGPAVSEFAPGDEVLAYGRKDYLQGGTMAERVSLPVRCVAKKPQSLSWTQAGALPLAGLTAYQLVAALDVKKTDTVLVHAAAGGVGSFAVQIAARRGARVIGTASLKNHEYVSQLGAEPVQYRDGLNTTIRRLETNGVDAVIDLVGGEALASSHAVMSDAAISSGRIASIVDAVKVKELGGKYLFVRPNAEQLTELAMHAASGTLRVEIAEEFMLEKTAEAFSLVEEGHVRGKVIIHIS